MDRFGYGCLWEERSVQSPWMLLKTSTACEACLTGLDGFPNNPWHWNMLTIGVIWRCKLQVHNLWMVWVWSVSDPFFFKVGNTQMDFSCLTHTVPDQLIKGNHAVVLWWNPQACHGWFAKRHKPFATASSVFYPFSFWYMLNLSKPRMSEQLKPLIPSCCKRPGCEGNWINLGPLSAMVHVSMLAFDLLFDPSISVGVFFLWCMEKTGFQLYTWHHWHNIIYVYIYNITLRILAPSIAGSRTPWRPIKKIWAGTTHAERSGSSWFYP